MSPKLASKHLGLTSGERDHLANLYNDLGAWTRAEAVAALGTARVNELLNLSVLGQQDTEMGPMLHLLATGRQAVLGQAGEARSLASQLDRAYFRLCLAELQWNLLTADDPFSRSLTDYAPHHSLCEAYRVGGAFLVGGKLTDGGYSAAAIRKLGRRLRSQALFHRLQIVLLTPSGRRGQKAAQEFSNFLELRTILPNPRGVRSSKGSRFQPVRRQAEQVVADGPLLTPALAQQRAGSLAELSLKILQLPRRERIQHARVALNCDSVMTGQQLAKHYGLQVDDLPSSLVTSTVLRPQAKADAIEVPTQLLITHRRMTRLSDARLLHLVNLPELRQNAGIDPNAERWIVTPKSRLTYEEPDAILKMDTGQEIAAESDIGFYSLSRIEDKLTTFRDRGFAGILYGMPSRLRCTKLRRHFRGESLLNVFETRWWTEN